MLLASGNTATGSRTSWHAALYMAPRELGLEARGLSEDLSARGEEINPQTLDALGPGEPVRSAVKVRSEAL